jgi:hypothetical protein
MEAPRARWSDRRTERDRIARAHREIYETARVRNHFCREFAI